MKLNGDIHCRRAATAFPGLMSCQSEQQGQGSPEEAHKMLIV